MLLNTAVNCFGLLRVDSFNDASKNYSVFMGSQLVKEVV